MLYRPQPGEIVTIEPILGDIGPFKVRFVSLKTSGEFEQFFARPAEDVVLDSNELYLCEIIETDTKDLAQRALFEEHLPEARRARLRLFEALHKHHDADPYDAPGADEEDVNQDFNGDHD
jgi:hypothetical protein